MNQGLIALIIVCGLIVPMVGFAIAGRRIRNQKRSQTDDLGRRLGARWFASATGLPYGRVNDPLGTPYSDTGDLFDYAFAVEYRGRRVVALEFTKVSRSAGSTSRSTHHALQVLGVPTPLLLLVPRLGGVPASLWPGLTEASLGVPDFDGKFMVLAKDPSTVAQVLTPAVANWLVNHPRAGRMMIHFAGDGVEVSGPGGLSGAGSLDEINDLVDLTDVIQYGAAQASPKLDLGTPLPPPGNKALMVACTVTLIATVIFWLTAFTISNPSSGLAVIGIIVGLVVVGILLNRFLARRRAR